MNKRLRVLHLTPVYPSPSSVSQGVFIQKAVEAQVDLGIDVTVLVCRQFLPNWLARRWTHYQSLRDLDTYEQRGNPTVLYARYIHIPRYKMFPVTIHNCANAIIKTLKRLPGQTWDIAHVNDIYPVGLASVYVKRYLGLPLVLQLHTQPSDIFLSGPGFLAAKELLDTADSITAVGTPLVRTFQASYNLVPNVVQVIRSGIGLPEKLQINDVQRQQSGGILRIVTVCNLAPLKGIDFTLRALAQLKDLGKSSWRFTIIGDGYIRPELEALARTLGIETQVEFLGRLPHEEAMHRLSYGDLFVMPSWNETFGQVYLEAMALGIPSIGCRGQGAGDIITEREDGILVEPRSVEELTDALIYCLEHREELLTWGKRAKEKSKQYSWQRNATEFLQVYRELLK